MPPEMISKMRRPCSTSRLRKVGEKRLADVNMLPPEKERERDRNQRRRGNPQRQDEKRQQPRAMSRLRRQRFGMQYDALARPVADQPIEAFQEARDSGDGLADVVDRLAQPRFGTAVVAHPVLDERLREGPDVDVRVEAAPDPFHEP